MVVRVITTDLIQLRTARKRVPLHSSKMMFVTNRNRQVPAETTLKGTRLHNRSSNAKVKSSRSQSLLSDITSINPRVFVSNSITADAKETRTILKARSVAKTAAPSITPFR